MTGRHMYVTVEGLRRRGWTDGMVRELLGGPDVRGRRPGRAPTVPLLLYRLGRVVAVERGSGFRGHGPVAPQAAQRRRQAVLATLRAEPIRVPVLPRAELERRAVRYRRQVAGEDASGDPARWQVGYLGQALRSYDALLDGLHAATGRAEAERLLRGRVYRAIAQACPWLAEECGRRLRDPGGQW
ncbi:hypothetical protein I3F58_24550 [Streptomyces sp. MUM 203J]|uniref:hypothetical protein n=1 Tax=Streptomyces sp. MUM 203J TaxID=2791990 RepID=UPI001F04FD09|nr:hypothetical protein [Streptomyces sp. MUM 203J]MCH0542672.1 hypothetical protein [Streptomyces sp. MUM 203J]